MAWCAVSDAVFSVTFFPSQSSWFNGPSVPPTTEIVKEKYQNLAISRSQGEYGDFLKILKAGKVREKF